MVKTHWRIHRRATILIDIGNQIQSIKERGLTEQEDVKLWRKGVKYKSIFNSKETWKQSRVPQPKVNWISRIWFTFNTPKFYFMAWLAILNRLAAGDRTQKWSTQHPSSCVLCTDPLEPSNHLFFTCSFSEEVWKGLTQNLLADRYINQWSHNDHCKQSDGGPLSIPLKLGEGVLILCLAPMFMLPMVS